MCYLYRIHHSNRVSAQISDIGAIRIIKELTNSCCKPALVPQKCVKMATPTSYPSQNSCLPHVAKKIRTPYVLEHVTKYQLSRPQIPLGKYRVLIKSSLTIGGKIYRQKKQNVWTETLLKSLGYKTSKGWKYVGYHWFGHLPN